MARNDLDKETKIFIAGHAGVVGSAILKKLKSKGYANLVTRSRLDLDLTDQGRVRAFFEKEKPTIVFLAAAQQGGLYANIHYPAKFIYENLMISTNVLHESFRVGTQKVFSFGCSSMYPKDCAQPMKEDAILSGPLEPTSEPFAVSKIAGLIMSDSYNRQYGTSFVTIIPTNVYGEGLDYDPQNSTVIPSLMRRFHDAKLKGEKNIRVWGSGKVKRDFLYSGDLAEMTIFLAENYFEGGIFNVGADMETSIEDLAKEIARAVGLDAEIEFDNTKPEGVDRKLQDWERVRAMGWRPMVNLSQGLALTYKDFLSREQTL